MRIGRRQLDVQCNKLFVILNQFVSDFTKMHHTGNRMTTGRMEEAGGRF